ncbi:MAG: hypothetical protein AAFV53_21090 [Myxococcota bacterium]
MAAHVDIHGDRLIARFSPERSAAIAGTGCAVVLFALTGVGVFEAVTEQSWSTLLGLPCSMIFAIAFAMLGLTRGHVTVDRAIGRVTAERRFFGIAVRRDVLDYGRPRRVCIDLLGRERRPFYMVNIDGVDRYAEVLTDYDADGARDVARKLAAFLGVFIEEREAADPPPAAE